MQYPSAFQSNSFLHVTCSLFSILFFLFFLLLGRKVDIHLPRRSKIGIVEIPFVEKRMLLEWMRDVLSYPISAPDGLYSATRLLRLNHESTSQKHDSTRVIATRINN